MLLEFRATIWPKEHYMGTYGFLVTKELKVEARCSVIKCDSFLLISCENMQGYG